MTNYGAANTAATDKRVPFQHIVLTGASGYVGRNLIRHFVARGVEVTALSLVDKGHP